MTFKYNNVYVLESSTVAGPYEAKGPLHGTFDSEFDNLYNGQKSWELAEKKALEDSIQIVLDKSKKKKENIDLIIAGDLLNQITSSCYASKKYSLPFLGIYSACATSIEGIIIGSSLIDAKNKQAYCGIFNTDFTIENEFIADSIYNSVGHTVCLFYFNF